MAKARGRECDWVVNRVHGEVKEQGEKDELRGSCFFAGTPTKQEWLQMGFSRRLFHFEAVFHFAVLVHGLRVALAAVWSHSRDILLQTSEDNSFSLGRSRQCSSRGNIVHAAEVKFKPRVCFCGLTNALPYLFNLICAHGCSVRRCCCLEPHESWTQKGLSILCWVRFRGPLSLWKWAKWIKGEQTIEVKTHQLEVKAFNDEEDLKGSYCEKLTFFFSVFCTTGLLTNTQVMKKWQL